ncbi:NAD(P)-binding domain-containing protein [Streptomyces lunaelactis]|uniref:NAD(P)-binding domain-containing protein n=1 Tax=Streptomyces lunaelactis TaxID=1535768 RepID=UPI0027B8A6A9|nr:NAD(P)-binding domain-containing protein [Streptomyces lunaelactis]
MGRALAGALLDAGHPTTVWNRSQDKGEELVARGAVRAASTEVAVRASELTVVCVVDHDASAAILAPPPSRTASWSTSPRTPRSAPARRPPGRTLTASPTSTARSWCRPRSSSTAASRAWCTHTRRPRPTGSRPSTSPRI